VTTWSCPARAKVNLFLYVTGKRADGYHDLCTVMSQISLCDHLEFHWAPRDIRVTCDYPGVPGDETNLAHRAAVCFRDAYRDKFHAMPFTGLKIHIQKSIPPGAGLGGGSSNAASVLMALNDALAAPFTKEELMALGVTLGADVPFFIFGSPALARGIGDRLSGISVPGPRHLVLVYPGIFASTRDVFENFEIRLTSRENYTIKPVSNGYEPVAEGWDDAKGYNDLEDTACLLYPDIREVRLKMSGILGRQPVMTGSGSALFVRYREEKSATSACHRLRQVWPQDGPVRVFQCMLETG
jgi:4-diphosphocytidyl-2-C-methyl-D-erythritol kinase